MDFALSREQKDIKRAAREFARGEFTPERALEYEAAHSFPRDLYREAAKLGFIGLDFPEEIGGGGMGVFENILVIEEFCKADSGIGMALHLAFLPGKVVKFVGTSEQQERFLGPVTRGEAVTAISLTEPDHGSDLRRVKTTLKDAGDRYVLNGTKIFTTNGAEADWFVVLAQEDPDAKPGRGMTTVVVERDRSSLLGGEMEINDVGEKMGLHMTSSSEVVFRDLEIPKNNLLGTSGQGLYNVFRFLEQSRIEIAAQGLGNAAGAFLKALEHAKGRQQFDRPIIDFQAIGHTLARMFSRLHAAKWSTYHAGWAYDNAKQLKLKDNVGLFTSMVKHQTPVLAKGIIDDAISILGGYGYFLEQDIERRYRDNRIVEIYEGTVEVNLNNMVRLLSRVNPDYLDSELL